MGDRRALGECALLAGALKTAGLSVDGEDRRVEGREEEEDLVAAGLALGRRARACQYVCCKLCG